MAEVITDAEALLLMTGACFATGYLLRIIHVSARKRRNERLAKRKIWKRWS